MSSVNQPLRILFELCFFISKNFYRLINCSKVLLSRCHAKKPFQCLKDSECANSPPFLRILQKVNRATINSHLQTLAIKPSLCFEVWVFSPEGRLLKKWSVLFRFKSLQRGSGNYIILRKLKLCNV